MNAISTKRDQTVADFEHVTAAEGAPSGRAAWRASADRLPLFSVTKPGTEAEDGGGATDDELVTYTIPAKPNAGLALDFLREARTVGAELAISWLIEEAVGHEGYDALVVELETYEGDGAALLRAFGEKIQRVVMGGLEGPKA